MKEPLLLSDEFEGILNELEYSDQHLFITGRAGTGKSTLLQIFRNTTQKKIVVLAPTGIAALNVRGQTIHSFFGFPPRILNRSEIKPRRNRSLYTNLDTIIIDEVSMVRADIIDNIDQALKVNRKDKRPFGGVQMIFFGDLFQLPPVVSTAFEKEYFRTTYATPYFFSGQIMETVLVKMIELRQVYRQSDRGFVNLLDNIRMNQVDYDDFMYINERYRPIPEDKSFYITLTSRNDIAHRINTAELDSITHPPFIYSALVTGEFHSRLYPADFQLVLKKEAQVMFLRNDSEGRYVNGTIGKIDSLTENSINVAIQDPSGDTQVVSVEKEAWDIVKYNIKPDTPGFIDTEVVGTFHQYPLKHAWAITIHKSQGKTFDKVIIDMGGGAFESGQTYVALSRCTTIEGVILKKPIQNRDIIVDNRITEYYEQVKYLS